MDGDWDCIVVGAGSAGCVLASRLSENPALRVLLLESGGSDRRFWIRVPIGYARSFRDPRVNWMYETEPEPALDGRRSYWPRGRVLGGSGSINAMAYVRGMPRDYDRWAALTGDSGWSWDGVLPWFKHGEDHVAGASDHHGAGGPLHVSDISPFVHPLCARFAQAAHALGLPSSTDFNGPQPEGVGIYPVNIRDGLRVSSASAYLRPAMRRPNLRVLTDCHVTRLLFDGRRAVGVEVRRGSGPLRRVRARGEVVLCAGTINSPQLLQLSGIGEGAMLARWGVPVVHDAPRVGQGLQDHLHITHVYRATLPTLNEALRPWHGKLLAGLRYLATRRGPLSMSVNQAGGFVRSGAAPDVDDEGPDLQLYFNPASYSTREAATRRMMNPDPFPGFSMSVCDCRPTSRGSITLASADPHAAPCIRPHYLSTERDVRQALAGARMLRALAGAPGLREAIAQEILPGPGVADDAALLADFRARADTIFHPVGSCAMGVAPHGSVVDARLRVHGVAGLRVVDASVFPSIPSGNTNAPTMMVAERAARLIVEDLLRR